MNEMDLHIIERIEAKFIALQDALARAEAERDQIRAERDRLQAELDGLGRHSIGPVQLPGGATTLDDDDWTRLLDAG